MEITLVILTVIILWVITIKVKEVLLFKRGRNPANRICKKCGAHQDLYQSNIKGCEEQMWWEEVYPIGNDPNCKCHSHAEYRS